MPAAIDQAVAAQGNNSTNCKKYRFSSDENSGNSGNKNEIIILS